MMEKMTTIPGITFSSENIVSLLKLRKGSRNYDKKEEKTNSNQKKVDGYVFLFLALSFESFPRNISKINYYL